MSHKQLTICYLTKKTNAIGGIAANLRSLFPKIVASQASSTDEIVSINNLDLIIADPEFKNIAVPCPVLNVISETDIDKCSKTNFVTESELSTFSLQRAVRNILDIERISEELKEASIKDELTDLYNQHFMVETLSRETKKALRYNYPLTLLYIGIDELKKINARFGPEAGDRVIVDFGLILKNSVREVDTIGRFYGDEFLAILPETNDKNALKVCERIQTAVKNFAFVNGEVTLSVSIGIAKLSSDMRVSENFLNAARVALTGAKKHGTSKICTFEEAKLIEEPTKENKELIGIVKQQILSLTDETKKIHFDNILKLFKDLPMNSKLFGHSEHVAFYSERLAINVGLSNEDLTTIRNSAFLHDIGKLVIDERIVMKGAPLTSVEYAVMRQHPVFAAQMLSESTFIKNEINTILHHHEHFDGSGYPDHMQGNFIPLISRIIGLVEAWDTMITHQPYRDALPLDTALDEIKKGAGKQFDPELVKVFVNLIEN